MQIIYIFSFLGNLLPQKPQITIWSRIPVLVNIPPRRSVLLSQFHFMPNLRWEGGGPLFDIPTPFNSRWPFQDNMTPSANVFFLGRSSYFLQKIHLIRDRLIPSENPGTQACDRGRFLFLSLYFLPRPSSESPHFQFRNRQFPLGKSSRGDRCVVNRARSPNSRTPH